MKKYFAALSATALISVAPYALASTDLTVTGVITPLACTPALSDGGAIDIGKISAKNLDQTNSTLVGNHPMQLTVNCDGPTTFAINPIDNNRGTALGDNWFGLGLTDNGEKIGIFRPYIKSALADGQNVRVLQSPKDQLNWNRTTIIDPSTIISVGPGIRPVPVEHLVMELEISTSIARADSLTLTDEVTFHGFGTFEMKYL